MIRLKHIYIKGFKEAEREINLTFSDEPITIIYGENGSGKTTFLKILHAIFKQEEDILIRENVQKIKITYQLEKKEKKNIIVIEDKIFKEDDDELCRKVVNWGNNINDLNIHNSILFGVHRGLVQNFSTRKFPSKIFEHLLFELDEIRMEFRHRKYRDEYSLFSANYKRFYKLLSRIEHSVHQWKSEEIQTPNWIQLSQVKQSIIKEFKKGRDMVSEKVKNAFSNTIGKAIDIEISEESYELPKDFWDRFDKKQPFLLDIIDGLDNSSLQKNIKNLLESRNKNSDLLESKIFRALLVNILKNAEEENLPLKSVNKLVEFFNAHLYRNKKLIVNAKEAYIQLKNGTRHELSELSSGERHILTFLTLFLISARGQSFFLIDEPEISLNTKWQRKILPLLSELSPNSQIIAATHSPSIAHKDISYAVKLI